MAKIIFDIAEFICEPPEVFNLEFVSGSEGVYIVSWTTNPPMNQGGVIDPYAKVDLEFRIDGGSWQPYPNNPVPYSAIDYELNFNVIWHEIPRDLLEVRITLTTDVCENSETTSVSSPWI